MIARTLPPLAETTPDADPAVVLRDLYRAQLDRDPGHYYLVEHSQPRCIANQVRTFEWYRPYLPERGSVLDWGCKHAPDSCILRATFGDRLDLHGCDFDPPDRFAAFHDYARTSYRQLTDTIALPYPSGSFDMVIGSGVLEHVAFDYESLKEVYRVLKPDGVVVVTYLPNWLSVAEWWRRVVRKAGFHRRLYAFREASQLLKRTGFYPVEADYHTYFWQHKLSAVGLGRWAEGLTRVCKWLVPIHLLASTLCFIGRKVESM